MSSGDYNSGYEPEKNQIKNTNNVTFIVAVSVLSTVAVMLGILLLFVIFKHDDRNQNEPGTSTDRVEDHIVLSSEIEELEPEAEELETVQEEDEVIETKYVDCNVSLPLYNGPGTGYMKELDIPVGEEVEVTEYTDNGYAKVRYYETEGYVDDRYLAHNEPYVWQYNEIEVENFVEEVLYRYVNALNEENFGIISQVLGGTALADARKTHDAISKIINSEHVKSVNCYNVKRISKTRVTVMRDSTITVYRKDGSVKDVTERYLTTVENTGNGMKVIKFENKN